MENNPHDSVASLVSYASNSSDKATVLRNALADTRNSSKTLKNIAIECGITMPQLLQIYREGALIQSLMDVADTIAGKMNAIVSATLERAAEPICKVDERKLALELCGLLGDKKGSPNVSVNVNQTGQKNSGFEESAKSGTLIISSIPEETKEKMP